MKRIFLSLKRSFKYLLWHHAVYFPLFPSLYAHVIRPNVFRIIGCKVGKNVFIGYGVYLDVDNASKIYLMDNTSIASQCLLLAHSRNFMNYCHGDNYQELPYLHKDIVIEKGVLVGMRSVLLPGIHIGEGSIIGAASVVTKNIPSWVYANGNPAKVYKDILER